MLCVVRICLCIGIHNGLLGADASALSWDIVVVDVLSCYVAREEREERDLDELHGEWMC